MGQVIELTLEQCVEEDATYPIELTQADGDVVPITGTLYFWVKENKTDPAALITRSSPGSGITIDYAAGGLATLTVLKADTAAMSAGTYHWGLWELDGSAQQVPLGEGQFLLSDIVSEFP